MALDFGVSSIGYANTGNIFASAEGLVDLKDITIASGQGALTEGTCLGMVEATGKYIKWHKDATDGSGRLAGILGCDIDATSGDVVAFMYIQGKFNKSKLTATDTITAGQYNYGNIVIEEAY